MNQALASLPSKGSSVSDSAITALLQKAFKLQEKGAYGQAISWFEKCLKKDTRNYLARFNLGVCKLITGANHEASVILHKLHEEHPEDAYLLQLCGKSYAALGQFKLAIKFYKRAIHLKPDNFELWIDLTAAASADQNSIEAVYFATQALALAPTNPRAYNNLGAALNALERVKEAVQCFETVLELDPNNVLALSNMAIIHDKQGEPELALQYLEKCLTLTAKGSQQEAEIFYKMSYPLLYKGELTAGWEKYEYGFKPNSTLSRCPKRTFDVPQWRGENIQGKKLLIWREQGLGDEIMFFRAIADVFAHCNDVIIECDPRLVGLYQRTFPQCLVRAHAYTELTGRPVHEDYDFHIAAGSLMKLFRSDIASFQDEAAYVVVDPDRAEEFSNRLADFRQQTLIGICWRSGLISAERNLNYTALSEWSPIFHLPNTKFVNLQYGDSACEIREAEQHFGIDILSWEDLDLKNDLEGVAALISQLDCVVSAGTAVAQIAGAVGTHLKLFMPYNWTMLGQDFYPWIPNSEVFTVAHDQPVADTLPFIAEKLRHQFGLE